MRDWLSAPDRPFAEPPAGRRLAFTPSFNQENDMDKDRIKGSADQAKGRVKEPARSLATARPKRKARPIR
jgi:hypothetical protein